MKTTLSNLLLSLSLAVSASAQSKPKLPKVADAPAVPAADPGWPRELTKDGAKLSYNQPQIDEWANYRLLKMRSAFALTPKGGKAAVGVAELEGHTIADMQARTVFIEDLKITAMRFPALEPGDAAAMEVAVRQVFPGKSLTVSLDRLLAGLDHTKQVTKPVEVKMDPPPIFFSERPAALLMVDGKPVLGPLGETKLEFVVNTNWDVFHDPAAKKFYLLNDKVWLTSESVSGEWTLASSAPAALAKVPDDWAYVKKALPVKVTKGMSVPSVIYSEKPAELIVFDGPPQFQKVDGTAGLLWAVNTESWFFQHSADANYYFLVSGRWFRAPKTDGPWTYAGNDLPEDFKLIPPGHPCADVLSSVPGTPEAADAVLLAQVPTQATVNVAEAEMKAAAAYDGDPNFVAIEGTPMSYAQNTGSSVIKVENSYYLCQDAVWFVSTAATGPWKICTAVPPVIYTIPASSPVHNVTYVHVEPSSAPATVTCSYTAGYFGAFVVGMAAGAALVHGSGYYYPPYVYYHGACPVYRPVCYPTYGCAAAYNPWTGGYAVGQRYYGPYASAGRSAWYNPATGGYGRAASVQTPYGGRTAAAGYNPRTDTAWATRQGNNGYAQWGTTAVSRGNQYVQAGHIATEQGGVARWQGSQGGGKVKWTEDGAKGVAYHDGNLYAGKDGNVYHRDESGDWNKYGQGGRWENANVPPAGNRPGAPDNRPGAPDNRPGNRPETLPGIDPGNRPGAPGNRPETLPGIDPGNRPGARPETLPGNTRPGVDPGNRPGARPETRPAATPGRSGGFQPPADVASGLQRDAAGRTRGEAGASRFQGASRSGGISPSTGSRSMNRGGSAPSRSGGAGRSGGGGRSGGRGR